MIPLSADPIESLTPERLSSWLSASIGEVSIASMTTKAVGTGQMASSYRLDLTYADRRPADAPDSVILKVSSQDESSRQMAAAASAYLREVRFYQNLAAVAGARVPRCYHADISSSAMDFVLVMEDMGPARSIDQLGGCSVDQAALAVAQAATLHGSTWGHPTVEAQDWLPVEAVWTALGGSVPAVLDMWLERFGPLLAADQAEVVQQLGPAVPAWLATLREHRCLWHGDFRLDNMLFDAQDGAVPVAVVDWQSVAAAPGIIDLAYFLGTSLDGDERASAERDLVSEYHQRLSTHNIGDYSLQRCETEYRAHAVFGLILTVPVSLGVQRTERGDAMFATMARRVADQIAANESYSALATLG